MFGLLVDDVTDMITVADSDIQPVPDIGPVPAAAALSAILVLGSQLVTHLDLSALAGGPELAAA